MSQSRFSIVLVGVSALLRRPLVSRLRPAAFTARGSGGFRRSALPSVSAFAARRVGLRAHGFRFSACAASEIAARRVDLRAPVSVFRHAPLRSCRSAGWPSGFRFRFSARTASGLPSASWFFRLPLRRLPSAGWPSGSLLPLFGMHRFGDCRWAGWPSDSLLPLFGTRRFGDSARRIGSSAFRFGDCRSAGWRFRLPFRSCRSVVGLRAHGFRFSARTASELPLGELVLPPSVSGLPSASWFFCLPFRRLPLGGLAFGFTASAFRHAPLRGCCSAGWPSGSPLSLFGTHRSASPHRRSEGRRSAPTRHLFHFKTLIPTC